MINYDDTRRDITIDTIPGLRTQSRLIIREPQISDSGNYTCSASNTEPASIYVFVSKGMYTLVILQFEKLILLLRLYYYTKYQFQVIFNTLHYKFDHISISIGLLNVGPTLLVP